MGIRVLAPSSRDALFAFIPTCRVPKQIFFVSQDVYMGICSLLCVAIIWCFHLCKWKKWCDGSFVRKGRKWGMEGREKGRNFCHWQAPECTSSLCSESGSHCERDCVCVCVCTLLGLQVGANFFFFAEVRGQDSCYERQGDNKNLEDKSL